eukprot:15366944-Ditylum_brightwellii.AAC.1
MGFCISLQHEWSYVQTVIGTDKAIYDALDEIIQWELIPVLLNTNSIDDSIPLYSLPLLPIEALGLFPQL